jgi:phosphatidate cytidylyltransferase
MFNRIVFGMGMGGVCIALFLFGADWMLAALLAAALSMGAYELTSGAGQGRPMPIWVVAAAMAMPAGLMALAMFEAPYIVYLLLAYVYITLLFGGGMLSGGKVTFRLACVAAVAGGVLPLMLIPAYEIFRMEHGRALIFMAALLPSGADIGGLLFGKLWGKKPLAPKISPTKTRMGSLGAAAVAVAGVLGAGLVAQAVTGAAVRYEVLAALAVLGSALAQIGDLVMSYIKREYGIKDFGSLIPGHGGVLDRIDSWLFTVPLTYMVFTVWPPIV